MGSEVTDLRLLKRYLRGRDAAAFDGLVDRYERRLLRLASAILDDAHSAQDAVQETLVRLAEQAERVSAQAGGRRADESLGPWLITVLRNCCIDRVRREQAQPGRRNPAALAAAAVDGLQQSAAAERDCSELLWKAVDRLVPLQRAAVLLRYRDGLSYQAIADELGKSVAHVGVLLHQAVARLRGHPALRAEVKP